MAKLKSLPVPGVRCNSLVREAMTKRHPPALDLQVQKLDQILLAWVGLTSVLAFLLFGYDKSMASRSGRRGSEFTLILLATLGGWLGGLLAMLVFRHKTAKRSFQLKYAASFLVWSGLVCARLAHR